MIVKRGNRYGVRVQVNGRRRWIGTFATKSAASAAQDKARVDMRDAMPDKMAVAEFVDFFLEGYKRRTKASSYEVARYSLERFKRDFGLREMSSIGGVEAERWARKNGAYVQPVTTLFNDARRKRLIGHNPFSGLKPKSEGRRNLTPLTEAEVLRLAECAERAHGQEMRALVLFAYYTGLRAGELFALEWRDVDLKGRRVFVRRRLYGNKIDVPKSGKPERLLPPEARDALLPLPRDREHVFATPAKGVRLSQSLINRYWQKVWGLYGSKVTLHELRHAAGWRMYVTLAKPSRTVKVQLGHRTEREVEDLYGHGDVGALEELEEAFYGRKVAHISEAAGNRGGRKGA